MKTKRLFLSLFLPFLLIGCSTSEVSPQPFEMKLVEKYKGEYEVGLPVDVENFFYYSDRSKVNISVSYTKRGENITEKLSGHIFLPTFSGDYFFACSSEQKTINKKISVVDSKPTLSIKDSACFVQTGKMVYFEEIYSELSPQFTPSTAELEVTNVQYAPFTFDITQDLTKSFTDYDFTLTGFTPKNPGSYRIYVKVVNGIKEATGVLNVVAARGKSDGNSYVYHNDDGYASNKVLVSDKSPTTFILPAAQYSEASYVVLDQLFENGDTVGIRFKGKNIPTLGLMASPSISGSYGISAITGYVLSFERRYTDRYTLLLPMTSVYMKDGQASRDELFGVDDCDPDKYYYLTASITGNTPSGSKFLHSVHWSICEIENYGMPNEHYKLLQSISNSGGWNDEFNIPNGRVVIYSSEKRDLVFQVDSLPSQGNIVQHGGARREGVNTYTFENTTTTNNRTTGNHATVNGYFEYKGNYSAGDFVSFAFKGYNIPGVALFCDDATGLTDGARGLYICPGSGDRSLNRRLTFYGPYRLDSSNPHDVAKYENIFWNFRVFMDGNYVHPDTEGLGTQSPFGYDNLTDDGDYVYTIKIVRANPGDLCLTISLHDYKNGAYQLVDEKTFIIDSYDGPLSGNIFAYPGYLSMGKYTTFSSYPVNTSPLPLD